VTTGFSRRLGRPDIALPDYGDPHPDEVQPVGTVTVYLGKNEMAKRLGLKDADSLKGMRMPPHDAVIGDRRGWLPETVDEWARTRPGRGRWGAR